MRAIHGSRPRALVLAGVVLMAGLGLTVRAWAYCANDGRNLRVMTFNVACVNGPTNNNSDTFGPDDVERMKTIAEHIKGEDPDVVIINEAWSEWDCKDPLIEELKGTYTSYIYELDAFSLSLNDSGLMLFAKDRFIEFDQDVHQKSGADDWRYLAYGVTETANGALTEWGGGSRRDVAYQIFPSEACHHHDCAAEKGVAMVRLRGLCDYNVAFTHTQAHYDLNDPSDLDLAMGARNLQMVEARDLFLNSLSEKQMQEEPVFFGGDLNIDGNRAHPALWPVIGKPEWEIYFTPAQSGVMDTSDFYACGFDGMKHGTSCTYKKIGQGKFFTDPGFFETSPFDLGQTTSASLADNTVGTDFYFEGDEGFRYDYILHNQPADDHEGEFLCMQHLRRLHWVDTPIFGSYLSDHMPIVADFGKRAPRCSPTLRFGEDNPDGSDVGAPKVTGDVEFKDADTRIRWPGSVQWYWIDFEGAMAIGTLGQVAVDVYQARDLSRPVSSFHKETSEWVVPGTEPTEPDKTFKGDVYVFDEPPYLAKVFATKSIDPQSGDYRKPDLGAKPTYTLSFHEVTCSTTKDDCPLKAGHMFPVTWSEFFVQPENGEFFPDKMYFTLSAGTASDGSLPEIKIRLRVDSEDVLAPNQFDENGLKVFAAAGYDPTKPDCGQGFASPCNQPLPLVLYGQTDWSHVDGLFETVIDFNEWTWGLAPPGPPGVPVKYFVRLGRNPAQIQSTTMEIRYETTLTLFKALGLICHVQESTWWDDWIHARFEVDSAVSGGPNTDCTDGLTFLGTFDGDEKPQSLESKGLDRYYTEKVAPTLCEEDDVDPYDYLSPLNPFEWFVTILDPKDSKSFEGKFFWADDASYDDADYFYKLSYQILHEDESQP